MFVKLVGACFRQTEMSENQKVKHITLSRTRPAAKDPRKVIGKPPQGPEKERIAFSLLGDYAILSIQRQNNIGYNRGMANRLDVVENRTAVLGSTDEIYSTHNVGFFETVLMAYNNHYNLRTSPDDWWFCLIRRVALAIDNNAKKDSVRKMFVGHEGKKILTVVVPEWPLSNVNYESFFERMSMEIANHVKVPEYVDVVTTNFSCTTSVQRIVSQITLMSSMQEFFEYDLCCCTCGIPATEMLGTEDDWKKLLSDLRALKSILQPIMNDLGLTERWWSLAEKIFSKLLDTYHGSPDKKWWSHILTYNEPYGSGDGNKKRGKPPYYSGWIVEFLDGRVGLDVSQFSSGLVTAPLEIKDDVKCVEDTAALVAGMVGMTVHEETENKRPSVQPFQGWALMLPPNSPLTV